MEPAEEHERPADDHQNHAEEEDHPPHIRHSYLQ